jgi:DNA repair protein RecO (recombination protein O)
MHAIVIKKQHTSEYDLLVTCYTKERGKLTAIAKSALKHSSTQAMHLDPLNCVEFELVEGRAHPIITSAQSERVFSHIKSSPLLTAMAHFFTEVIERVVYDNERDDALWDTLESALIGLDVSKNRSATFEVFRQKQYELLEVLGYAPQTSRCIICDSGTPCEGWLVSPEHGGMICLTCASQGYHGIVMSKRDISFMRGEFHGGGFTRSVIDVLFEHLIGAQFASLEMVYRFALEPSAMV